jgi:hypothetical protein
MARAVVSAVRPSKTGAAITLAAPTVDGDAVRPGSALLVHNTSGGALNVTVVTGATVGGRAIPDDVISVPAGAWRLIGPFTEEVLPQTSGVTNDLVHVDYATPASFERALIGLGL